MLEKAYTKLGLDEFQSYLLPVTISFANCAATIRAAPRNYICRSRKMEQVDANSESWTGTIEESVGSASGCLLMFSLFTCVSLGTVMRSATAPEARILVPKESKSRIPELDGLRGLAILLVLLYHFVSSPRIQPPLFHKLFAIGWSGVDLFFVLSGFLIGGILLDVRESPNYFRTFYGRRFYRIVPLYYLWIGAYFVIALFGSSRFPWRSIPVYLLFLQNYTKIDRAVIAVAWLGALWSLAIEEQFYLIVPTVVRFLTKPRLLLMLYSAILCAPVFRILLYEYLPGHPAAPYVLTPCRG